MSVPAEQVGDAAVETKDVQMQVEQPAQPTEAPSAAPPADQGELSLSRHPRPPAAEPR